MLGNIEKVSVSEILAATGGSLIFGDVVVRVHPTYAAAMHIDTDESNAAALGGTVYGEIIK